MEKLISAVAVTFIIISLKTVRASTSANDDVFSSVAKMATLVDQEKNIVSLLDSYLQASKHHHQIIQKLLQVLLQNILLYLDLISDNM